MGLFGCGSPGDHYTYHLKGPPPSKEEKEKKEKEEKEKKEKEPTRYVGLGPDTAFYRVSSTTISTSLTQRFLSVSPLRRAAPKLADCCCQSSDPSKAPIINMPAAAAPAPAPARPQVHHYLFPNACGGGIANPQAALGGMIGLASGSHWHPPGPALSQAAAQPNIPSQWVPYAAPPAGGQLIHCRELDGSITLRTLTDCVDKASPGTLFRDADGRMMWLRTPKSD